MRPASFLVNLYGRSGEPLGALNPGLETKRLAVHNLTPAGTLPYWHPRSAKRSKVRAALARRVLKERDESADPRSEGFA